MTPLQRIRRLKLEKEIIEMRYNTHTLENFKDYVDLHGGYGTIMDFFDKQIKQEELELLKKFLQKSSVSNVALNFPPTQKAPVFHVNENTGNRNMLPTRLSEGSGANPKPILSQLSASGRRVILADREKLKGGLKTNLLVFTDNKIGVVFGEAVIPYFPDFPGRLPFT